MLLTIAWMGQYFVRMGGDEVMIDKYKIIIQHENCSYISINLINLLNFLLNNVYVALRYNNLVA